MKSEHTPGPWTFDTISMETGDYGVSQRDLRISICHVHNAASLGDIIAGALRRGGGRFEQSDAKTQMANARLIAAAPDMLAALLASEQFHNPNAAAMRRAAIAKATGAA